MRRVIDNYESGESKSIIYVNEQDKFVETEETEKYFKKCLKMPVGSDAFGTDSNDFLHEKNIELFKQHSSTLIKIKILRTVVYI